MSRSSGGEKPRTEEKTMKNNGDANKLSGELAEEQLESVSGGFEVKDYSF
jgi:hypothetical protein